MIITTIEAGKILLIDARSDYNENRIAELAHKTFGVKMGGSELLPGGGYFLRKSPVNFYHVQSVYYGLVIAANGVVLEPAQTRKIAADYLSLRN